MSKIVQEKGFVIYVYSADHDPRHVHVYEGSFSGPFMKVNLDDSSVMLNFMKPASAKRALKLVEANRELLVAAWDEMHGTTANSDKK